MAGARARGFPASLRDRAPLAALLAMQTSLDAFVVIEKHLLARQEVIPQAKCRGPLGFAADDETLAEVDQLFDRLLRIVTMSLRERRTNRVDSLRMSFR